MKKGSKRTDTHYSVEIKTLGMKPILSGGSSSLRKNVGFVQLLVPTMDNYTKVYRKMRQNAGVYVGHFLLPPPPEKQQVLHVVVTIVPDKFLDADLERYLKRIAQTYADNPAAARRWARVKPAADPPGVS